MNNKDVIQKAKEFYENMSDEELKERLIEAGFEVIENGDGQVIFTEEY